MQKDHLSCTDLYVPVKQGLGGAFAPGAATMQNSTAMGGVLLFIMLFSGLEMRTSVCSVAFLPCC